MFGTDEAFSGFQFDIDKAGGICNQAEEYIHRINSFLEREHNFYNVYSREIYQKKYSETSAMKRYRAVFKRLCQSIEKWKCLLAKFLLITVLEEKYISL